MNACEQTGLIEAWHDGRLGAPEQASLERHIATCVACAEQRRVLGAIREAVREPRLEAPPLAHHRARGALLRRAADMKGTAHSTSPMRARVATFAIAAVLAVVALAVGWSWGRSSAPLASASASARSPVVSHETSVTPASGARFERSRTGGLDLVQLSSGTLAITAASSVGGERFVVRTEDAELESKESSFRVEADAGKIKSVTVERGMVDVRYAGFLAVIPAGGSWHAKETTAAVSNPATSATPSVASSSSVAVADALPSPPPAVRRTLPVVAAPIAPAPPIAAPSVAAPPSASSVVLVASSDPVAPPPAPRNDFSNAMRALERGEYDAAASTMGDFSAAHPNDARADEADYVRVIALQRAGHAADAKSAARFYLSKWPQGAHRKQAEAIAAD